jgi:hypothetical protein
VTVGIHRALLVANSKFYEDPTHLPELNAPIYDMSRLKEALTHPTIGVFDPAQVKLLPNARFADALQTIESFFLECEPDDTLLLYYSGHGKLNIDNQFFLCVADTKLDRLLSTAIRDEQVNAMMRSSPARSFVLVLDCCSSGGWKSATDLLPDPLTGSGRFLITSSRAGQNSSDAAVVTESSPFTKYLVEAITDADVDVDDDGFVDIDEIYKFVERSLRDSGQQAQRDFDKSAGTVALARRPVEKAEVVREPGRDVPDIGSGAPTSLSVVPELIEVTGVRLDDLPVVERIYVFNRGGGVVDWTADSDDAWISLEPLDDYVRVSLAPTAPGPSRGTVYVRAPDGVVGRVPVQITLEGGRTPWWPRFRTSLVASGWTWAKTIVVAALALLVAMGLGIAAIVGPTPPGPGPADGDGDGPRTDMVLRWRAEPIGGEDAPPEVINGVSGTAGQPVAAGGRGLKAATWLFRDGAWQTVPIPSSSPEGEITGIPPFGGKFLAVGASSGPDGRDAAAWWVSLGGQLTPIDGFERPGDQVIHKGFPLKEGRGIIAVGQNDGDGAVWFSEDGEDWILEPDDTGELGGVGEQALYRVARFTPEGGTETLVAVGYERNGADEDGAVWIAEAEDPFTWRRVRDDAFQGSRRQRMIDVTETPNGGVVAVGYADSDEGDLDAAVWSSEDGVHWERQESYLLGGPGDQKIERVISPAAPTGLPMFVAGGSDTSSGTMDAAMWYFDDDQLLKKQTSIGTPLGGGGDQEILALLVRPPGIWAFGYDSRSGPQLAAIWFGE